jgi:hypothetical protein
MVVCLLKNISYSLAGYLKFLYYIGDLYAKISGFLNPLTQIGSKVFSMFYN